MYFLYVVTVFSSFPPGDSWYCVTYSISDSELRLTCWSSRSLTHGHSSIVLALTRGTLIYMPVNNLICSPISPFSHVASVVFFFFFWLTSPTLILFLASSERRKKERWECQRGSTRQLRVINHCHGRERDGGWKAWEMECSRHGRNLSPEMRWINLFSSLRFVVDTRLWHHILPKTEALWVGEVNASRADRHMDCALSYCQSSSSQRPRIFHEDSRVIYHSNAQTPAGNVGLSNEQYTDRKSQIMTVKLSLNTKPLRIQKMHQHQTDAFQPCSASINRRLDLFIIYTDL